MGAVSQDAPRALADIAEGSWIAPRLGPFGGWVGSAVPRGYPAYARVLHPVERGDGERPARWADVCAATGRRAHALMQWRRIAGVVEHTDTSAGYPVTTSTSLWPGGEPYEGSLAAEPLGHLLDVLAGHTGAGQDCYFALWEGFGWIHGSPAVISFSAGGAADGPRHVPPAFPPEVLHGPRLRLPNRDYLLFSGPLRAGAGLGDPRWRQSPNLCWPADRSWCVATEIDFDSTLVGGPVELVHDVLAHPELEAWPVDPGDSLAWDADLVNRDA